MRRGDGAVPPAPGAGDVAREVESGTEGFRMNCQELDTLIPELARDGAGAGETMLAHLSQCERCALRLEEERRLTVRLGAFAAACAGEQAPAWVEQKLLAAFCLQRPSRRRRGWIAAASIGSVAAAILLVTLPFERVEPLPPLRPVTIAAPDADLADKPAAKIAKSA